MRGYADIEHPIMEPHKVTVSREHRAQIFEKGGCKVLLHFSLIEVLEKNFA